MGYYFKTKIGVMGSSSDIGDDVERDRLVFLASELGRAIAERSCVLITGATSGLPDAVSRAASQFGGQTIGISPAVSVEEHVSKYKLPADGAEVIIYTGFGLKGRNVINVRACDVVIIVGGGIGTLNEFTIAYDEDKVIGVLNGSGGLTDKIEEITSLSSKPRQKVLFNSDPGKLCDLCLAALAKVDDLT
jgi:uncharacterized protein (TIGR00725 family)